MTNRLCQHLSTLLSGKVQQGDIKHFMNTLPNEQGIFVESMKALSQGFKDWLDGKEFPFECCRGHFTMMKCVDRRQGHNGHIFIPKRSNNDLILKVLNYCLDHPEEKDYILSGMMKLHTSVDTAKKPSQSSIERARQAITSVGPTLDTDLIEGFRSLVQHYLGSYSQKALISISEKEYMTLFTMPANPKKRVYTPSLDKTTGRDLPINFSVNELLKHPIVGDLINNNPLLSGHYLLTEGYADVEFKTLNKTSNRLIGSVSMIPEVAGKYRTVAVPMMGLLSLNYPLSQCLHKMIRISPNQGVGSHDNTCASLSKRLSTCEGTMFHSLDMSDFTDRFPYQLQRVILEEMSRMGIISQFDVDVQDVIVKGLFDFKNQPIQYSVGTPQGTFASFPLASLANELVAQFCFYKANKRSFSQVNAYEKLPFKVIGDDIVIWDNETFNHYSKLMGELGVCISQLKTRSSTNYIEMCSKWITKDAVYLQKKIKDITNVDSFIRAYFYYKGNLEIPDDYQYISLLPRPFGITEEDPLHPVSSLSRISKLRKEFPQGMTKRDFFVLFSRDNEIRNFCFILKRPTGVDWEFNPLLQSRLHDIDDTLESLKCKRLDDSSLKDELEKIEETLVQLRSLKPSNLRTNESVYVHSRSTDSDDTVRQWIDNMSDVINPGDPIYKGGL